MPEDQTIQKAKHVRAAYRGHISRDLKKAKLIIEESPADLSELEAIYERLNRRNDDLVKMDDTIVMSYSEASDIEREVEDALKWNDEITDCRTAITKFLNENSRQLKQQTVSPFQSLSSREPYPKHRVTINLPKLKLKSFSGDKLEWQTFWEGFSSAIDDNPELSDIEKMNYLSGQLRGEAARVIAGLPLSNGNYSKAVELLRERYGQKQALINCYMDALTKIPSTTIEIKRLRMFYDSCENYIRGLESLGIASESYGSLLLPMLIRKLPEEIRRTIFRCSPKADSSLRELRSALLQEIETREKSHVASLADSLPSSSTVDTSVHTAGALFSGVHSKTNPSQTSPKNKQNNPTCPYCGEQHRPNKCLKITTVSDRISLLRQQRRCFNCLGTGHITSQCYSRGRCLNCKRKHHTSLCESENPSQSISCPEDTHKVNDTPKGTPNQQTSTHMGTTQALHSGGTILMQSALVRIIGPRRNIHQVRALFDTGSQRSFITEQLKEALHLHPLGKELLEVTTFGSRDGRKMEYEVVKFHVQTNGETIELKALVTPTICPPLSCKMKSDFLDHVKLQGLQLADPPQNADLLDIDIIIGNDLYGYMMTGEIIKCADGGIIAMNSKFGWLLSGPVTQDNSNKARNTMCNRIDIKPAEEPLDDILSKFWETNTMDTLENTDIESDVLKTFNDTIQLDPESGRYVVRLPWKDNKQELPSNFELSKKRLNSLQHSLQKRDPTLIENYNNHIKDQVRQGFIEEVTVPSTHGGIVHYIPHFPVFKSDSATTQMRVVYDASAKSAGKLSLNDCLFKGPNLMQELMGILLRFRLHTIAFTADIEKAFLQIALNQIDRDATRFLWLKDTSQTANNMENVKVYRFCRVLFGAAPSPFLLGATIRYHLNQKKTDKIAMDLKESMYMDNVVTGVDSETEATEYYSRSREYLKEAGMNLRQWTTSSSQLTCKTQEDKTDAARTVKVLGVVWNSESDTLSLSLKKLLETIKEMKKITKRSVLSIASKLFDPLGTAEPFTIRARIMMQELWRLNTSWDKDLPDNHRKQWLKWFGEIKDLDFIKISRQYFPPPDNYEQAQLHIFCDSSMQAYGAVAYMKIGLHTTFVIAKSKVAPIKKQTLPKLELQAALLGATLAKYIKKSLIIDISRVVLWSDSQIVLSWLSTDKHLPQFIETRVRRIKEITTQHSWRYCPTATNPADLLTRGISVKTLTEKCDFWFNGPRWMMTPENNWPTIPIEQPRKTNPKDQYGRELTAITSVEQSPNFLKVVDLSRHSTFNRAVRVTSLVLRFIAKCKKIRVYGELTAEDLLVAEERLIKALQQQAYSTEIPYLSNDPPNMKQPAIVQQLGLYLDKEGLIRCRGRLQDSSLAEDTKFPLLLPKDSRLSELIVQKMHSHVLHNGVRETLTQLRQRYWIPQGRQYIKRLLKRCVTCRKVEGRPFQSVITPPLPESRLCEKYTFFVTGVDYAGPLFVLDSHSETSLKMYICLFTCANTRAVHLELVEDLSANAFIRAFRRFVSRRGVPNLVISDNAKNFKASSKVLESLKNKILQTEISQRFLSSHGIKWQFIAERAPWWGGFYERLVGLMKRCLKKTIGKASLNIHELITIITEVEAVLNSRPLTYPYSDINDGSPLTPSHFLCGHRLLTLPDASSKEQEKDPDFSPSESTKETLTKREKHYQKLVQRFWCQWRKEYLTNLREFHSAKKGKSHHLHSPVKAGDVVLIHDDLPRIQWKLAVVKETLPGKDGLVRAVKLRTGTRNELIRPIEKLYPLEIAEEVKQEDHQDRKEPLRRSERGAAKEARQRIQELMDND